MDIAFRDNSQLKGVFDERGHRVTRRAEPRTEMLDVSRCAADLVIVYGTPGMRERPHGLESPKVASIFYSADMHVNARLRSQVRITHTA